MGRHLLFTNWRVTCSEAILPTLPKIAFTDRLNERLAFVTSLLSSASKKGALRNGAVSVFAYANYSNYSFFCLSPTPYLSGNVPTGLTAQ